jgi:hypothetical protein
LVLLLGRRSHAAATRPVKVNTDATGHRSMVVARRLQ